MIRALRFIIVMVGFGFILWHLVESAGPQETHHLLWAIAWMGIILMNLVQEQRA
jgi:hypothetical protein